MNGHFSNIDLGALSVARSWWRTADWILDQAGRMVCETKQTSFTPPNWIFGPVWTVLYMFIAIVGWRSWQSAQDGIAWKLWWAQLILNFSWSPVFFVFHKIGLALGILILLVLAIIGFIAAEWPVDRWAAFLFVPYAAWTAFALLLNAWVYKLNRARR